ncbi:hypothetical protein V6N12_072560 [Hibiscus sabdariffa]|uniref:Uncharacterized protein n=1 Tax=Hibiscus sabdariffa TaxID=183260 RepID=A0ABR2AZR2_9ROSI
MPRSRRKEGATPSDDYGWRWLKEHLAGKTRNVKACESVSAEVRKNIAEQLKELQKEKAVRQRRKEELEERIRIGNHGDYGDSDEEEDELTIARRESIRSRHEWEERQRQRARTGQDSVYEPGRGSNSASQLFRSFSVRKPGRSEREHQWTNFDSPGARLANMDPVLERSKSLKQPKLTTSFLKNAKAKLGRAISKLILHEALPARIAESPFLPPVLQVAAEIGKSVKGPSAYEVTGVYLDEEYTEIQAWVNGFKPIWKERVLSETMAGVINVIQRIEPSMNDQILAMNQLLLYRDKVDSFGTPLAQAAILKTNPEEDPLSAWIEEREDLVLDSEHNFSWLPEELLNETDEETQGKDINDISLEESVQLSTSSSGDGGGDDDDEVFRYSSVAGSGFHSYQPTAYYPPYLEQNPNYGLFDYHLPYRTFPTNDASYDTHNVMSFSHGMESDQNQGTDETGDAFDVARHSCWW